MMYSALTATRLESIDGSRVHEAQAEEDETHPHEQRVEHLSHHPSPRSQPRLDLSARPGPIPMIGVDVLSTR
jgi:hypothetical protein